MKKQIIVILIIAVVALSAIAFIFWPKPAPVPSLEIILNTETTIEVNTQAMLYDYIENVENGTILSENAAIDTSKIGNVQMLAEFEDLTGVRQNRTLSFEIVDTQPPQVTNYTQTVTLTQGKQADLLSLITSSDNSGENVSVSISGAYDFNTPGTYPLQYILTDTSGNTTVQDFELIINKKPVNTAYPYYIKINRKQNVVMIYGLDAEGQYTKLSKVFVCSTGKATPLGKYRTEGKYKWRWLFGDVYGQYATVIDGDILFHSVPYTQQSKDTLEYWEYNKLGTKASLGCIRLTVRDAKWIYDNCPSGTMVELFDSDSLNGIEKPAAPTINENSENRGWDPTDPDPKNPWNQ